MTSRKHWSRVAGGGCAILIALAVHHAPSPALAEELEHTLFAFSEKCFAEKPLSVHWRFAPVIERKLLHNGKLNKDLRWGAYQFTNPDNVTTPDHAYKNKKLPSLGSGKKQEIWIVRDIKARHVSDLPPYIWHVISIPRRADDHSAADASLVHSQRIPKNLQEIPYSLDTSQPKLTKNNLAWLKTHSFVLYEDSRGDKYRLPTYNMADDLSKRTKVTGIWQTLLGVDMVDKWLFSMEPLKKNRDNRLYLHSFYFWPIDTAVRLTERCWL